METAKNADFFRQFNHGFFQGDREFIENNITEDVVWKMVGSESIVGKQAFLDTAFGLEEGYSDLEYSIDFSVMNDNKAALKGKMIRKGTDDKPKVYAFCDFYELNGESECKVKELTTFLIAIEE
ncbi:nuclear transport factor 2 family protein [Planococcus halocryophilus]|uniref:nuclear transport factor 2 family protein n=1 Tax=Planococcus halocryophilus TaxID=1215089 RepID=UPI001F0F9B62|nr:nuclear transport factor 2 family protein [Planococcus halocryophilus]MCH4827921.1 nuclear transport factor 2 family protein [Planococcus halocryophilus]